MRGVAYIEEFSTSSESGICTFPNGDAVGIQLTIVGSGEVKGAAGTATNEELMEA